MRRKHELLPFNARRLWPGILFLVLAELAIANDVTGQLIDLGNKPDESGQRGVGLNVWDLQPYRGKIYLGMGSTSHDSGPIPLWAYDHAARRWDAEPEAIIEQEAIELFRVLDDRLYIPAADPKGSSSDGSNDGVKFYRRTAEGRWIHFYSVRALHTAHIRDLAEDDGLLIGVGNSRRPHDLLNAKPGAVAISLSMLDSPQTASRQLGLFRTAISLNPPGQSGGLVDADTSQRNRIGNWFFSLFRLHDGLYASTRWLSWAPAEPEAEGFYAPRMEYPPQVPPFPTVLRWDRGLTQFVAPPPGTLDRLVPVSPERDTQLTLRPYKPALFGELWFAPFRTHALGQNYLNQYNQSVDFVVKPANGPGQRITLPDADALGEAVLVHQDQLFVLANARRPDGRYRVIVYALDQGNSIEERLDPESGLDLDAWRQVLHFDSANLARSFARIDQTWYFGLGFAGTEAPGQAGSLLRLN
jgi:hypothetical protein